MDEGSQSPQKTSGRYGKRPVWQWVVIYIIAGAIVYGLVYFLLIHKGNGSGY